jgi:hypothetical protein
VNISHEGLSLWYGTPDAPAPLDEVASREAASVTIGVRPASPANSVQVRFRVDNGLEQVEPARLLRTDYERDCQYFATKFPPFHGGSVVEYCPTLSCAGRQVPGPSNLRYPSKFRLAPPAPPAAKTSARQARTQQQQFTPGLTFLCSVSLRFDKPDFVGETPEGIRVAFYALEGTLVGPKLRGKVLPRSADHLFIRPDGIAVVRVRAIVRTDDGAMLDVEYDGKLDLGEDAYDAARRQQFPPLPPLVMCPRVLTGSPQYKWLNRLQCLAVGRVRLRDSTVEYDVFAVEARMLQAGDAGAG